MLTASVDLARLGLANPAAGVLTAEVVERLAKHYLRRPTGAGCFTKALRESTSPLQDEIWALERQVTGAYRLFDPLTNYGIRARVFEVLPSGVWSELQRADLSQEIFVLLAHQARCRLLLEHERRFSELAATASRSQPGTLYELLSPSKATEEDPLTARSPLKIDFDAMYSADAARARANVLLEADVLEVAQGDTRSARRCDRLRPWRVAPRP